MVENKGREQCAQAHTFMMKRKYKMPAPVTNEFKFLLSVSSGNTMSRLVKGIGGVMQRVRTTIQSKKVVLSIR